MSAGLLQETQRSWEAAAPHRLVAPSTNPPDGSEQRRHRPQTSTHTRWNSSGPTSRRRFHVGDQEEFHLPCWSRTRFLLTDATLKSSRLEPRRRVTEDVCCVSRPGFKAVPAAPAALRLPQRLRPGRNQMAPELRWIRHVAYRSANKLPRNTGQIIPFGVSTLVSSGSRIISDGNR